MLLLKISKSTFNIGTLQAKKNLKTSFIIIPTNIYFCYLFLLVAPTSLENVQNMWVQEVKEHCPAVPYILVSMKSDLRDSFEEHIEEYRSKVMEPVSASKGEEMKKVIGAQAYLECSARMQYNQKEVFETTIKVVLHPPSAVLVGKNTKKERKKAVK